METDTLALARLAELYLRTFFLAGKDRQPLKVGIDRALFHGVSNGRNQDVRRAKIG